MALINLRNALMAGKKPMYSLSHSGTSALGFFTNPTGALPLSQTFTCWYRFLYPNEDIDESRVVFKYGNSSNGAGYGSATWGANISSSAALNEQQYWNFYNRYLGKRLENTGWHHLAYLIKSGTYPTRNAAYVDGKLATIVMEAGSAAYRTPSGTFSLCGRDGEHMNCTVQVFHPRIYSELLDSSAIADDMLIAGQPTRQSLVHYWDGTVTDDKVQDFVGNWDLTFSTGCEIVEDAPSI